MIRFDTIEALYEALDGPAAVGRAIGITTEHAASIKRRGRIPPRYWPAFLAALRDRGHEASEADMTRLYNIGSSIGVSNIRSAASRGAGP